MRREAVFGLMCLTGGWGLFADEGDSPTEELQGDLVAKIDAPQKSSSQELSLTQDKAEQNDEQADIIVQVQPGTRVIVQSSELSKSKPVRTKPHTVAPSAASHRTVPSQHQTKQQTAQQASDSKPQNQVVGEQAPKRDEVIGVTVFGSYLYWIAEEDGLEYVLTGVEDFFGTPPYKAGKTYRPKFSWDSGFRAGALYQFQDSWDISFAWTRFATSAERKLFDPEAAINTNSVLAFWTIWTAPGGLAAGAFEANAKWGLSYWTLELMTGIPCKIREHLRLRPSAGLVQAGINQKYNLLYTAGNTTTHFTHLVQMKNDYHGIGLRGACDAMWDINRYFGFFSRVGFSLLAGHFHIKEVQFTDRPFNFSPLATNLSGKFLNVRNNPFSIKPEIDFTAGLHVEYPILQHKSVLRLDLGWDFLLWFDQNQMMRFIGEDRPPASIFRGHYLPQQGDLFLQGLNVTAGWEF